MRRVLVLLGVGVVLELTVFGSAAGFAQALSGPCTDEYTPALQEGSARDQICENGLLLGGAFVGSLALVPVALVTAVWKIRGIARAIGLAVLAAGLAVAMLATVIHVVESQSPVR